MGVSGGQASVIEQEVESTLSQLKTPELGRNFFHHDISEEAPFFDISIYIPR